MPYAPSHKPKTRKRIVDAAKRMFKLHGYNGVGVNRIMGEAGLTHGGFYAHFSGKEELFAEVVRWFGPSDKMHKRALPEKCIAEDNLKAFVRSYLSEVHMNDVIEGCPLASLTMEVSRAGPVVRQSYTHALRDAVTRFRRQMTQRETNTEAAAYSTLALCIGGLALARAVDSNETAGVILKACEEAAVEQIEGA
jgi:AcrR family transcriptional regulator